MKMNVNLHLRGDIERFINELVDNGLAANKTEAIRMAIVRYYEEHQLMKKKVEEEPLSQHTIEAHWNNPSDEKAAAFYLKRYIHEKA
jgi:Arc/MetJ-type ribon-helix-helix transcriptional regulator